MTRIELNYLKKLLQRIKPRDQHVYKALALVEKDLANYDSKQGQMKDTYESENYPW